MKEIEEWMDDCKFIYFSFNIKEDENKVKEFKIVEKSEIPNKNLTGYLPGICGYILDDISHCWIDLTINDSTYSIRHYYINSIIPSVFVFNRIEWLNKKRKIKLLNIINKCQ